MTEPQRRSEGRPRRSASAVAPTQARGGPALDSAEVARRLLSQVLRNGYQQGDRLPSERDLGIELRVGRSVVREALRSLALLGIVELKRGDGTYLRAAADDTVPKAAELGLLLGPRRIRDLGTVGQHLESVVAGLAAARRTDAALDALDRLQAELAVAVVGDSAHLMSLHREFHETVRSAASNHVLARVLDSIGALLDTPLNQALAAERDHRWIIEDHGKVLEAIRYRDEARAREAMAGHMRLLAARLETAIEMS
jgi:GntR family transcriptional regulator, transcriptional repressor for pyruvate dehydrogenase complex